MSDATIRQDILDELEFEPSVNANDIGVTVDDGIVTLTGHVATYPQKLAVELAALRIKGVTGLAEEIEVRLNSGSGVHDDEIARRAVDMLKWSTVVPEGNVQVKVQDGWVTLTGSLDWAYQSRGAVDVVRGLRGVTGVTDVIDLVPRVATSDVKGAIESALRRNAQIEAGGIKTTVVGNTVRLEGTVKTWHEREIVERAAWSTPSVLSVEDRLTVG